MSYINQSTGYVVQKEKMDGKWRNRQQHRIVMERIVGRKLLPEEVVHHKDKNKTNNEASNLLLLANEAEHRKLHADEDALAACGHADWRRCGLCHQYDSLENMLVYGSTKCHKLCRQEYGRIRYEKNAEAVKAAGRERWRENPDLAERQRDYRAKNRDELNRKQRAYKQRRKEALLSSI